MLLLLRDKVLLEVYDNGICNVLDFERLPFALRKQNITLADFIEWASNRTLSIGRSYAKEILNSLREEMSDIRQIFRQRARSIRRNLQL